MSKRLLSSAASYVSGIKGAEDDLKGAVARLDGALQLEQQFSQAQRELTETSGDASQITRRNNTRLFGAWKGRRQRSEYGTCGGLNLVLSCMPIYRASIQAS